MKTEVEKIFNDLDALLDFCRLELLPYNPADLYNRQSKVWQSYEASKRPRRHFDRNNQNGERKEWKPRGQQHYRTRS
jgi:hypothetical protein